MLFALNFMIAISFFDTDALQNYYVTPNKITECSNDWSTCLILEEYASQLDEYFTNDTIFYFEPGSHRLNNSLNFTDLHNITLQGLPDSEVVDVLLGPLVTVTWKNCSNIEVSSISFSLLDYFTYGIVFEYSHYVQLSNISVFGNEFIGCSSIISRNSTLGIRDSSFAGI